MIYLGPAKKNLKGDEPLVYEMDFSFPEEATFVLLGETTDGNIEDLSHVITIDGASARRGSTGTLRVELDARGYTKVDLFAVFPSGHRWLLRGHRVSDRSPY